MDCIGGLALGLIKTCLAASPNGLACTRYVFATRMHAQGMYRRVPKVSHASRYDGTYMHATLQDVTCSLLCSHCHSAGAKGSCSSMLDWLGAQSREAWDNEEQVKALLAVPGFQATVLMMAKLQLKPDLATWTRWSEAGESQC